MISFSFIQFLVDNHILYNVKMSCIAVCQNDGSLQQKNMGNLMPKMGSNKTDNCSQALSSFQNILFQRPSILETLNHSSAQYNRGRSCYDKFSSRSFDSPGKPRDSRSHKLVRILLYHNISIFKLGIAFCCSKKVPQCDTSL